LFFAFFYYARKHTPKFYPTKKWFQAGGSGMNVAQKIRSRAKCIQPVLPQNAFNMKGRKTDFFH
jgi:hypothetical protein